MTATLRLLLAASCCVLAAQVSALSYCGGLQICTDDEFCCFGRCCHISILIVGGLLVALGLIGVMWCCCCSRRSNGTQVVVLGDQGLPPYSRAQ